MDGAVRQPSLRQTIHNWIYSDRVQHFIIGLIILNAITLGLETSTVVITGTPDPDQLREALSEAGYPMV